MDPFVLKLVLTAFVGGSWVVLSTIIAERAGTKLGGVIAGLPSSSLIAFLFIGWTQSPQAAAQADGKRLLIVWQAPDDEDSTKLIKVNYSHPKIDAYAKEHYHIVTLNAFGDAPVTLPDGSTLDQIDDQGKVAINNFDQVAFHGRIETEGAITGEKFRAVFISDGRTTQVAAREGNDPPVGPPLAEILESGGVAISDFDEVAFHGRVVDPGFGGDTLKAVFTTDGPVAREASVLPDGNTLDDINADGGVAINFFGEVAFHGSVLDPGAGSDSVKAVLTGEAPNAAEVVVKEGDTLPDGTTVDEIKVHSGVAINLFGDVVFHGRTGAVKAVFTQYGLVAKVGDNLADGTTTLKEIWEDAGVAINPYGFEVAFHGKVDSTDAVFVGLAP